MQQSLRSLPATVIFCLFVFLFGQFTSENLMANNQLVDATINVRIWSESDQLKWSISHTALGSSLAVPSVIWDALGQQTEERVKHSPCPQTVHAERGKWPVDKNCAMLRSALGELSPCANGTQTIEWLTLLKVVKRG